MIDALTYRRNLKPPAVALHLDHRQKLTSAAQEVVQLCCRAACMGRGSGRTRNRQTWSGLGMIIFKYPERVQA